MRGAIDILTPRLLKIANWSVLAVLVLAGFFWGGREFALGVLVGGLVMGINFHLLHQALRSTLEQVAQNPQEGSSRAKAWSISAIKSSMPL